MKELTEDQTKARIHAMRQIYDVVTSHSPLSVDKFALVEKMIRDGKRFDPPAEAPSPASPVSPNQATEEVPLQTAVLQEALQITAQDRNKAYGNPEDNFQNIANLWNDYFGAQGETTAITAADVAALMVLMKVARLATNPTHRDSWVDVAGYGACGYRAAEKTKD